ncbi:MAG: hypothetical protein J6X79_06685 [Bacteroidales bacterium]|nr:hypothetical protein [Bacteroidales bacterium]
MKTRILFLVLCLAALGAQTQTEYRIDQSLGDSITKVQVYSGWNVRLIHDTVNLLSIATPCEYYFTEGNEPQICRQHPDGWLSLWKNTSMPQGTLVEIHYRDSLKRLDVHPGASVSADTLLIIDKKKYDESCAIRVKRGGHLTAKYVECNRWLSIDADTAAFVHIGTLKAKHLQLWSNPESTLLLDSIDARDVKYRRDPTAHDNLWTSDTARHIKVKTADRWFARGMNRIEGHIGLDWNTPLLAQRYNNPYFPAIDLAVIEGLKTNVIPINQRWGLSLGLNFRMSFTMLQNNTSLNGRVLQIDTVSLGVNRQRSLTYFVLSFPVRLHYSPKSKTQREVFKDLHIGLEPRWNFFQRYNNNIIMPNNRFDYTENNQKVNIYNPLQLRIEAGYRFNVFDNMEVNFYFDLLSTYRKETGMGKVHAFGFQVRF